METDGRVLDRRAYVVDPDVVARANIRQTLTALGVYSEEFESIDQFLSESESRPVGCVIMAADPADGEALDLISRLRAGGHGDQIVILAEDVGVSLAVSVGRAGALDVVCRAELPGRLPDVLKAAFDQLAAKNVRCSFHKVHSLTPRERQVLVALTKGFASRSVAQQLNIALRTVEMHRYNILKKLGAANISQAIAIVKDEGIL